MLTNEQKVIAIQEYLLKKVDNVAYAYSVAVLDFMEANNDILDMIEVINAKVRLDLLSEIERDILNIIGKGYYK